MSLKIRKSKSSKLWPQLTIIEGFWRMEKTTLIKELLKQEKFSLINEPHHLIEVPNVNDPHQWYFKKHIERQELARQLMKNGKKVIMERSVLSNIAFDYAQQGKITKENENVLKNLPEFKQFPIIFLYAEKQFIKNAIQKLKDDFVKNIMVKNKKFYYNYVNFYKNILSEITGNNALCLNVAPNGKFLEPKELIKYLVEKIKQSNNKEKVKEICAAVVLIHNNKILLLHDKNWNHYVLPQGHREADESLRQTAVREAKEETGYSDLALIKKIKQYQYHYLKGDKVIYKNIHVYLVKILNLASQEKQLDKHENYINCFFEFNEAIKRARWPQDKELIAISRDYLKK